MIATRERPEQRVVLHGISWQAYEALARATGENHVRLTYDEGELEIMTLSFGHENAGEWLGRLLFFLAMHVGLPLCSGGSTTLKRALSQKGLEPDKSFWIKNEAAMRGKKEWDESTDPPPDLVVEVDISNSSLDRLGIHAALQVPEIWHYDGKSFRVLGLGARGKYRQRTKSPSFPMLPLDGIVEFLSRLGTDDEVRLMQNFVEWVKITVPN